MADLHKAIRAIHNNVIVIKGDTKEDIIALDDSGNSVTIDWTNVEAWTDPNEYQYKRAAEYPNVKDQLDDLYHNGINGWKNTIKAVKDKYPKG
jgi:hypothetical protein|tara:strand:+ start:591 stop:869 length:279 start_codon:yes stop_codon:yes gene_type:complete